MSDGVDIVIDNKEFMAALIAYEKQSSKDMAAVLNKKAIDLCFKAGAQVPKSFPVKGRPKRDKLYNIIAAGGISKKTGKSLESPIGKAVKGQGNKALAEKIWEKRKGAKGYSAAVFRAMAQKLGAKITKKSGTIKGANAIPAKAGIKQQVVMTVKGLEKDHVQNVMQPAIDAAIPVVIADMVNRINESLEKAAKKHSGRGRRR